MDTALPGTPVNPMSNATGAPPLPLPTSVATTKVEPIVLSEHRPADCYFAYTVTPPEPAAVIPTDIIVVIDTSGSMGKDASVKNSSGEKESFGLTVLDIVKHAAKTIIHTLGSADRFALVEFNASARVVHGLMPMSSANRKSAITHVESLRATGRTNLWGGLKSALDLFTGPNTSLSSRNCSVMLLTDGVPNIVPPRGHIPMLQRYVQKLDHGRLPCTVATFGFGYDLDSQLLFDVASEAGGAYAFIPDSSLVGTIFVNALSNIRSTVTRDTRLKVTLAPGTAIAEMSGQESPAAQSRRSKVLAAMGTADKYPGGTETVTLGPLQGGQAQTVILKMSSKAGAPPPVVTCSFLDIRTGGNATAVVPAAAAAVAAPAGRAAWCTVEKMRLALVDALRKATEMVPMHKPTPAEEAVAKKTLTDLAAELQRNIEACPAADAESEKQMQAMLVDVRGQLLLAASAEHYQRWGRHYMLSVLHAHYRKQCNNFKDPSVQFYGGKMFQDLRDTADDVFCGLPPPKPSARFKPMGGGSGGYGGRGRGRGGGVHASVPSPAMPVNMRRTYYNSHAPCVAGDCSVLLGDGSTSTVEELLPGDVVASMGAAGEPLTQRTIEWIVRTASPDGSAWLVHVPSERATSMSSQQQQPLRVTPYHPIRLANTKAAGQSMAIDVDLKNDMQPQQQQQQQQSQWRFPADVGTKARYEMCTAVYSFILAPVKDRSAAASMIVAGVECATLGHGTKKGSSDGDVLAHPYFGSRTAVLRDVEAMVPVGTAWPQNHIVELCAGDCLRRDPQSGLVAGLMQQ